MTTDSPDLRVALERPENKLARAVGKVHFGGTRAGHYFDKEGWAFLLDAVAVARAALAAEPSGPVEGLRAAVGHFLALDDAEEERVNGEIGPPDYESEWVKAREAMREALRAATEPPALDVETIAIALAETPHGTEYRDRQGRLIHWRSLGPQEQDRMRDDAARLLARLATPASEGAERE